MKYAFLHKNFRELNFEKKMIFSAHTLTMIMCFFPWFQANPAYESTFFHNAFQGPGFLIGFCIFCISFVIFYLFVDQLLEKESIRLPFDENTLYMGAGIQQILLLVLIWSVLFSTGKDFGDHQIRFGIFIALISQITGIVATFLNQQIRKQSEVRSFFQHPEGPDRSNEFEE